MALNQNIRTVFRIKHCLGPRNNLLQSQIRKETTVHNEKGGFNGKPGISRFGLIKAACTVIPGVWFGATISKNGAAWLEENEIFVPEDDDD